MIYSHIREGRFLSRPNRFIAHVETAEGTVVCHVKNTGRCRELLIPGTRVWIDESFAPGRKTKFDLITVDRQGRLVNMDSQAPNRVFAEWARKGGLGPIERLRPECRFGQSRFDFCLTRPGGSLCYVEVKGCTLEEAGVALFPDAPTERGVRHLRELIAARQAGYEAAVCFIIQMKGPRCFEPNRRTHPAFADALLDARAAGVEVSALDCTVAPDRLNIDRPVPVRL